LLNSTWMGFRSLSLYLATKSVSIIIGQEWLTSTRSQDSQLAVYQPQTNQPKELPELLQAHLVKWTWPLPVKWMKQTCFCLVLCSWMHFLTKKIIKLCPFWTARRRNVWIPPFHSYFIFQFPYLNHGWPMQQGPELTNHQTGKENLFHSGPGFHLGFYYVSGMSRVYLNTQLTWHSHIQITCDLLGLAQLESVGNSFCPTDSNQPTWFKPVHTIENWQRASLVRFKLQNI
jgi:hypothetical protein